MKTYKILALTALAAGVLTACSEQKEYDAVAEGTSRPVATTAGAQRNDGSDFAVIFNLKGEKRDLPVVTDFLTAFPTDAKGRPINPEDADGTLYYENGSTPASLKDANGDFVVDAQNSPVRNPEYNPVYSAIDGLDGFSTIAPFDIPVSSSVDASTLEGNVFIQAVNYGDESPWFGEPNTNDPLDYSDEKKAEFEVSVVSHEGAVLKNSVIRITPTKPFAKDTRYVVVLTRGIKSTTGGSLVMPEEYAYLAGNGPIPSGQAEAARGAIQNWQKLALKLMLDKGRNINDRAMAYTFTTGGQTDVMQAMAEPTKFDSVLAQVDASKLPAPKKRPTVFTNKGWVNMSELKGHHGMNNAKSAFTTGVIELPYYLPAPKGAFKNDGISPLDDDVQGNGAKSGYASCAEAKSGQQPSNIKRCLQSQLSAANVILGEWKADKNAVFTAKGSSSESDKAKSNNITQFYPFAKEQGNMDVPVMVVQPALKGCSKPAEGWPVVIYQHDLKENRVSASVLKFAESMASKCIATVAIDLPLHGPLPNAKSGYVVMGNDVPLMAFVNEAITGRDVGTPLLPPYDSFINVYVRNKSKAVELLKLRTLAQRHFGLTSEAKSFTPQAASQEYGTSGSLFFDYLHFQTLRDNMRQAVMDLLNLNASIASMDYNADGKPDFDTNNIHFVGKGLGAIIGMQFVALNNANANNNDALNTIKSSSFIDAVGGLGAWARTAKVGEDMVNFFTSPKDQGGGGVTKDSGDFNSLFYMFQATLDSVDPLLYANLFKSGNTPFVMFKTGNEQATPSRISGFNYAGFDQLAKRMGAMSSTIDADLAGGKFAVEADMNQITEAIKNKVIK